MEKMENQMENLAIAIEWYVNDNWYGQNYRLIFTGYDGEGFITKAKAAKHTSMLKKYAKFKFKESNKGKIVIDKVKNYVTYIYCSMGPSWSCNNMFVKVEDFKEFEKNENERLRIAREIRNKNKYYKI
jgi:hypothetical protein